MTYKVMYKGYAIILDYFEKWCVCYYESKNNSVVFVANFKEREDAEKYIDKLLQNK